MGGNPGDVIEHDSEARDDESAKETQGETERLYHAATRLRREPIEELRLWNGEPGIRSARTDGKPKPQGGHEATYQRSDAGEDPPS